MFTYSSRFPHFVPKLTGCPNARPAREALATTSPAKVCLSNVEFAELANRFKENKCRKLGRELCSLDRFTCASHKHTHPVVQTRIHTHARLVSWTVTEVAKRRSAVRLMKGSVCSSSLSRIFISLSISLSVSLSVSVSLSLSPFLSISFSLSFSLSLFLLLYLSLSLRCALSYYVAHPTC